MKLHVAPNRRIRCARRRCCGRIRTEKNINKKWSYPNFRYNPIPVPSFFRMENLDDLLSIALLTEYTSLIQIGRARGAPQKESIVKLFTRRHNKQLTLDTTLALRTQVAPVRDMMQYMARDKKDTTEIRVRTSKQNPLDEMTLQRSCNIATFTCQLRVSLASRFVLIDGFFILVIPMVCIFMIFVTFITVVIYGIDESCIAGFIKPPRRLFLLVAQPIIIKCG